MIEVRRGEQHSLEHHEVVSDVRVPRPTTQGVNGLLGDVELGGSVLGVRSAADSVDLLVHLGTLVVTVLTSTGDREHDLGRVPSTDTGDLSETTVGFSGKFLLVSHVTLTREAWPLDSPWYPIER